MFEREIEVKYLHNFTRDFVVVVVVLTFVVLEIRRTLPSSGDLIPFLLH